MNWRRRYAMENEFSRDNSRRDEIDNIFKKHWPLQHQLEYYDRPNAPHRLDSWSLPLHKLYPVASHPDRIKHIHDDIQSWPAEEQPEALRGHQATLQLLHDVYDKPNAQVRVYRSVPHNVDTIHPRDWITYNPTIDPTERGQEQHTISMLVPASHIYTWPEQDAYQVGHSGYSPPNDPTANFLREHGISPEEI